MKPRRQHCKPGLVILALLGSWFALTGKWMTALILLGFVWWRTRPSG